MSLEPVFSLLIAKPTLQAVSGAAVLIGLPIAQGALSSSIALSAIGLNGLNALGFGINCATVSVDGRLDGAQDASMRQGNLYPDANKTTKGKGSLNLYLRARDRSLVTPSGWAFTIWGPIYLGETIFCLSQSINTTGLTAILPHVTAPFVAANLFQSLWCASFRPESFNGTWTTFLSPAMLAGTAFSLSHVNVIAASNWLLVPLSMHFGWVTAATLVNLNSSLAASHDSETLAIASGHASAVLATAFGVGITLAHSTPAYGLTIAWALSACATGVTQSDTNAARIVQKYLCFAGAAMCAATSVMLLLQ
jgi:hypothetical protein